MVRPFFAGLRPNHHPSTKHWSFYIALPFVSSHSAHEARMPLSEGSPSSVLCFLCRGRQERRRGSATGRARQLPEGRPVVHAIEELSGPVRRTLRDLVHNRKTAWPLKHFLPGVLSAGLPDRLCRSLPTEEDSGPGPALKKMLCGIIKNKPR